MIGCWLDLNHELYFTHGLNCVFGRYKSFSKKEHKSVLPQSFWDFLWTLKSISFELHWFWFNSSHLSPDIYFNQLLPFWLSLKIQHLAAIAFSLKTKQQVTWKSKFNQGCTCACTFIKCISFRYNQVFNGSPGVSDYIVVLV